MRIKTCFGEIMEVDYIYPGIERREKEIESEKRTYWRIRGGNNGKRYEELGRFNDEEQARSIRKEFDEWVREGAVGLYEFLSFEFIPN